MLYEIQIIVRVRGVSSEPLHVTVFMNYVNAELVKSKGVDLNINDRIGSVIILVLKNWSDVVIIILAHSIFNVDNLANYSFRSLNDNEFVAVFLVEKVLFSYVRNVSRFRVFVNVVVSN